MTALKSFFEAHDKPMTVTNNKKVDSDIMCFQLINMRTANKTAYVAAKTAAFVTVEVNGKVTMKGNADSYEFPEKLAHGTSVENALNILLDGAINPGPGIAGEGIYAFAVQKDDSNSLAPLLAAWRRTATGGYNKGAVVPSRHRDTWQSKYGCPRRRYRSK